MTQGEGGRALPGHSPSLAKPLGPGTFQCFLPCVQAQFSNSGRKVSGTAIRGEPATSEDAVEPQEVLSLLPDNELASFSSHLLVSEHHAAQSQQGR